MQFAILLPPSEGKASGGDASQTWTAHHEDRRANAFPALDAPRLAVIQALQSAMQASETEMEKLFGVKGDALDAALETNRRLPDGPLLPAIHRYTGVMFDYLEYASLDDTSRGRFDSHTVIFSGVWGLLRPTDLIPDYKLKIDAAVPGLGNVASYWKPHISRVLNPLLEGAVVWDLLPGAHRRAWDGKAKMQARWQVKFVERVEKAGKTRYRTVSHWSKALKGALLRFLCAHQVTDAATLAGFQHPQGYHFRPALSKMDDTGGELWFVKESPTAIRSPASCRGTGDA